MADPQSWTSLPNSVKQRISALALLQEDEPKKERSSRLALKLDKHAAGVGPSCEPCPQQGHAAGQRHSIQRQQPQLDLWPLAAGRIESPLAKLLRRAQARKAQQASASSLEQHAANDAASADNLELHAADSVAPTAASACQQDLISRLPVAHASNGTASVAASGRCPYLAVKDDNLAVHAFAAADGRSHNLALRDNNLAVHAVHGTAAVACRCPTPNAEGSYLEAAHTAHSSSYHQAPSHLGASAAVKGNRAAVKDGPTMYSSKKQASRQSSVVAADGIVQPCTMKMGTLAAGSDNQHRLQSKARAVGGRAGPFAKGLQCNNKGPRCEHKGKDEPLRLREEVTILRNHLGQSTVRAAEKEAAAFLSVHGRSAQVKGAFPGLATAPSARGDTAAFVRRDDLLAGRFTTLASVMDSLLNLQSRLAIAGYDVGGPPSFQLARYMSNSGGYLRHGDRSASCPARELTIICYLNSTWTHRDAGQLRVYAPNTLDDAATTVPPEGGTVVIFDSGLEHEVLPTYSDRYALTLWLSRARPQLDDSKIMPGRGEPLQLPASSAASSQTEAASHTPNLSQEESSPPTLISGAAHTKERQTCIVSSFVGASLIGDLEMPQPGSIEKIGKSNATLGGKRSATEERGKSLPEKNLPRGPHHGKMDPSASTAVDEGSYAGGHLQNQKQALLSSSPDISEDDLGSGGFVLLKPSTQVPDAASGQGVQPTASSDGLGKDVPAPTLHMEEQLPHLCAASVAPGPFHHLESSWAESSSSPPDVACDAGFPMLHPVHGVMRSKSSSNPSSVERTGPAHLSTTRLPHELLDDLPASPMSSVSSSAPAEEDSRASWGVNEGADGCGNPFLEHCGQRAATAPEKLSHVAQNMIEVPSAASAMQPAPPVSNPYAKHSSIPIAASFDLDTKTANPALPVFGPSQTDRADGVSAMMPSSGNGLIFVSVAAYRDPETRWTLTDLFAKAAAPEHLRVGVVWQVDALEDESFTQLPADTRWHSQIRQIRIDWREATGPCKARHLAQALWAGEQYYLQIDSHMRFAPGWDEQLLQWLRQAESASGEGRAVLSAYPPSYEGEGPSASLPFDNRSTLLCADRFDEAGMLLIKGRRLARVLEQPIRSCFWAAGFSFSTASLLQKVPYDADLPFLFFGEELSMLARMWRHGFEVWAPPAAVAFHLWSRAYRHTFQKDIPQDAQLKAASQAKVRLLLGASEAHERSGGGVLGSVFFRGGTLSADDTAAGSLGVEPVRNLDDFYISCGVDFRLGQIFEWARLGGQDDESAFA